MTSIKIILKKLFDTWTFDSYLTVQNRVRKKYKKIQNIKHQWCLVNRAKVGEVVAGWGLVRKLNAFEERYLAWILLLRDETLVARNQILSFAFFLFLWDDASQKLRIPAQFVKCELQIRTLQMFLYTYYWKPVQRLAKRRIWLWLKRFRQIFCSFSNVLCGNRLSQGVTCSWCYQQKNKKKKRNTSILEIFVVLLKGTPNSEIEEVNNIFLKKVTGKYFPFYKTWNY